jgi:hypothetical protein
MTRTLLLVTLVRLSDRCGGQVRCSRWSDRMQEGWPNGVGFTAPSHVLQIGSNPAAILINDYLAVLFDETPTLLLR